MGLFENISLQSYNTFGIRVSARWFAKFTSLNELQLVLSDYSLKSSNTNLPLLIGGGSNILFTKNVEGLVLKNEIDGIEKIHETNTHVFVKVGAGVNWHQFVLYCIKNEYGGVENLSLIPGCVGASPIQNIGAYGVEIKDVFHQLEAYHIQDQTVIRFSADDCEFGYRESVFKTKYKRQFAILNVTYKLSKFPIFNTGYGAIEQELEKMNISSLSIKAISDAVIRIRTSKLPDPKVVGNAGSFFKNPVITKEKFDILKSKYINIIHYPLSNGNIKLAAGWLIEQCGWKGYREGDAGVHPQQALVLVNYGNALGNEVYQLAQKITSSVKEKFDINLQSEVNIL